jgi:hypothetical protein
MALTIQKKKAGRDQAISRNGSQKAGDHGSFKA